MQAVFHRLDPLGKESRESHLLLHGGLVEDRLHQLYRGLLVQNFLL